MCFSWKLYFRKFVDNFVLNFVNKDIISEHQQKCQIEGLRKHYKQCTEERDGLQSTRAKNEKHLSTLDSELDEAIEYGETVCTFFLYFFWQFSYIFG